MEHKRVLIPAKATSEPSIATDMPIVAAIDFEACIMQAKRDGVDIESILQRHRYQRGHDVYPPLPLVDYFRVERDIARALDDLTAHLSTRKLTYKTGEFILNEIKKSENLVDAMQSLSKYFNMMHGDAYNSISQTDKTITFIIDDADFPYAMPEDSSFIQFIGECVQIKTHCLLDSLCDGLASTALQRVGIKRSKVHEAKEHLSFWPRPPQIGKNAYTLTYNLAIAQHSFGQLGRIDLSSEGVLTRVINHLEDNWASMRLRSCSDQVRELVEQGYWNQTQVGEALNLSTATLRRRLSEEGETFRGLIKQSRLGRAMQLLDMGQSVQTVSDALDYSDVRAFSRAFKRWKGMSPSHYLSERK